jgi:hypothetical protein
VVLDLQTWMLMSENPPQLPRQHHHGLVIRVCCRDNGDTLSAVRSCSVVGRNLHVAQPGASSAGSGNVVV